MKLVNRIFMVFGALSVFSLFQFDAMALAYDDSADCSQAPEAGKYCQKAGTKPKCKPGCYCPGGKKDAVGDHGGAYGQVTSACVGKWDDVKNYLESRFVYYCPEEFPNSEEGAKNVFDCYWIAGDGKKQWYKSCDKKKGLELLPDRSGCQCMSGYTWDDTNSACVEKTYTVTYECNNMTEFAKKHKTEKVVTVTEAQVILPLGDICGEQDERVFSKWRCQNGSTIFPITNGMFTMPAADVTCIATWNINCPQGEYFPLKKTNNTDKLKTTKLCVACISGCTCKGGQAQPECSKDDGGGEGNGDGGTSAGEQGCEKGQYYDGTECVGCETGYFCPGDGNEYKCPEGTSPNDNGETCQASVSKTEMTNCWKYYDAPSAFRKCVYGVDVDKWK